MGIIESKKVIYHTSTNTQRRQRKIAQAVMITGTVILFCVMLIYAYIYFFYGKEKVFLKDYTKVTLQGYDGEGSVLVEVIPSENESISKLLNTVIASVDKTLGLSNEDVIQIDYSYNANLAKELGIRVIGRRLKVEIKDLPKPNDVTQERLFSYMELEYENMPPITRVSVENIADIEPFDDVIFEIVNPKPLYNLGDNIEVKATIDREKFVRMGYTMEGSKDSFTKTIAVENMDSYVKDYFEVDENALEQYKAHGSTLFGQNPGDANDIGLDIFTQAGYNYSLENNNYTFSYGPTSFISAYFSHIKPELINENTTLINSLRVIYATSIKQSDGKSVNVEAVVIYRNLIKDSNGKLKVDLDDGTIIYVSTSDTYIKDFVKTGEDDDYESVRY